MTYVDKSGKELERGSIFIIDGGTVNGFTHFVVNSLSPLSVSYCIINNLDVTAEVHRVYEYSTEDLFKPCDISGEAEFSIVSHINKYSVYNLKMDVEETKMDVQNLSKSEAVFTTLDSEKAIYFLLAIEYKKTFVEIDGLNQQRDGFTFDEWLEKQGLMETL
jgi:hypothetical protein